jgi:hypothetical protein
MNTDDAMGGLPGEALVRQGLVDFQAGRLTICACLVSIARWRLIRAGLIPSSSVFPPDDAELELYRLLCLAPGDAYSRYNALLRELASFENALDHRLTRAQAR